MIRLEIAGLIVELNVPMRLLDDSMFSFLYKGAKEPDIYWDIKYDDKYIFREKPDVRTDNLNIYCKEDMVAYEFKNDPNIPFMIVAKEDYKKCTFYLPRMYENANKYNNYMENYIKLCLFNVFREMFILACTYLDRLPIHASSILYDEKAYLFTGPSGIGKSTHANMCKEAYGCEILNGDIAIAQVVDSEKKKVLIHGCPWCGTSGIYVNKKAEIGGVVFLKQSGSNNIYEIDKEDIGIRLLENHFIPFINKNLVDEAAKTINILANSIRGYLLECTNTLEAVEVVKKKIM